MKLEITFGQTVSAALSGHSAVNGAVIPDTATITLASNDPTVATVPATLAVPAGGAQSIPFPVTVLAVGATDFTAHVVLADGTAFDATSSLLVDQTSTPGLATVTIDLVTP